MWMKGPDPSEVEADLDAVKDAFTEVADQDWREMIERVETILEDAQED